MNIQRIRNIWRGMRYRCNNPKTNCYHRYGGRGIKVCDEWNNSFNRFMVWAILNGYSDDLTLERVNNNGNYEPDNCTWIPILDQANNRRDTYKVWAFGELKTFKDWSNDYRCVVDRDLLKARVVVFDWEPEEAITIEAYELY